MKIKTFFSSAPVAALLSAPAVIVAGCGEGISASVWKHGATSTELWGVAEQQKSNFLSNVHLATAVGTFTTNSSENHFLEIDSSININSLAKPLIDAVLYEGARVFLLLVDNPREVITSTLNGVGSRSSDIRFVVLGSKVDHPQALSLDFAIEKGAFFLGVGAAARATFLDSAGPAVLISGEDGRNESKRYLSGLRQGINFYNENISRGDHLVKIHESENDNLPASLSLISLKSAAPVSDLITNKVSGWLNDGIDVVMNSSPVWNLAAKAYFVEHNLNNKDVVFPIPASLPDTDLADVFNVAALNIDYLNLVQMVVNKIYESNLISDLALNVSYQKQALKLNAKVDELVQGNLEKLWGKSIIFDFDENFFSISNRSLLFESLELSLKFAEIKEAADATKTPFKYDEIIT